MQILFLDVASHKGSLACVTEQEAVAMRSIDHRIQDHELVPLMEETIREAGWSYENLTHLACVTGPGGFMSIRSGVASINALAFALRIPSAGVHLSDLFAARCTEENVVWMHSTKKTEIFTRGFGIFAKQWPEPKHVALEEFLKQIPNGSWHWMGELLPEHEEVIRARGATPVSLRPLPEVLPRFLSGLPYEKRTLEPWYGRAG